ncbi:MAG: hypothetical protein ACFCBU_15595, partial [Cyanophyceae cyanobacterium]
LEKVIESAQGRSKVSGAAAALGVVMAIGVGAFATVAGNNAQKSQERAEAAQQEIEGAQQALVASQDRERDLEAQATIRKRDLERDRASLKQVQAQKREADSALRQANVAQQQARRELQTAEREKVLLQGQAQQLQREAVQVQRLAQTASDQLALAETNLAAVQREADITQTASTLERVGTVALRLRDPFDGLQRAMAVGLDLKTLTVGLSPADYPAKSPMYALDQLLNTPEFRTKNQFEGHNSGLWSISFSPDGNTIATASRDSTAKLWDLEGNELQTFSGHEGEVNSVSFSPDRQIIITAADDGTAKLWDRDGNEIQTLTGHQTWVLSASFSPAGNTIVTASGDGTAKVWPVETIDSLLAKGCDWLRDYLTTNPNAPEDLQQYCSSISDRPRQNF